MWWLNPFFLVPSHDSQFSSIWTLCWFDKKTYEIIVPNQAIREKRLPIFGRSLHFGRKAASLDMIGYGWWKLLGKHLMIPLWTEAFANVRGLFCSQLFMAESLPLRWTSCTEKGRILDIQKPPKSPQQLLFSFSLINFDSLRAFFFRTEWKRVQHSRAKMISVVFIAGLIGKVKLFCWVALQVIFNCLV